MPDISVLQVDGEGTIEGSAGDALRASPNKWLRVPANHPPFSVRVDLAAEPCPLWEILSFRLKVQGVYSFHVAIGDQTSDTVQVCRSSSSSSSWCCSSCSVSGAGAGAVVVALAAKVPVSYSSQ